MARAKFIDTDDFELTLTRTIAAYPDIAEACLRAGADVIADEMKTRLQSILLPQSRRGELVASFGITPMKVDREGNYNVHLGFDGYQEPGYGKFPNGVPFQLIARSFESGAVVGDRYDRIVSGGRVRRKKKLKKDLTYWREPTPFAAPAVRASRSRALKVMTDMAEKEMEKRIKGEK